MENHEPDPFVKMFYEAEMQPIMDALDAKRFSLPEVQVIHDSFVKEVRRRYGCVNISLNDALLTEKTSRGPIGVSIISHEPAVVVYVRAWMQIHYGDCQQDRELFETTFVTAFLHEIIHLAYGLTPKENESFDRQHMYDAERIVWAKTCEDVIRLFVERGRTLDRTGYTFYEAWKSCGKNQLARRWRDFIADQYKDVNLR